MQDSLKKLILELFDIGAIEFGSFKFKHHEKYPDAPLAPMKINLRTPAHPKDGKLTVEIVNQIAFLFLDLIEKDNLEFNYIVGIPRAGEPFAEIVAKILDKPLLHIEKIESGGKRKIGKIISSHPIEPGKSVLLVDDVMTRGESKGEAMAPFENIGLKITAIIFLVDREEGGMEIYRRLGYRMIAAFTATKMMEVGLNNQRTSDQEFQRCKEYLLQVKQFFGKEAKK